MIRLRQNTWQLNRRVPKRYHAVEPRRVIVDSLHTDSKTVATEKAKAIWSHLIEAWEAKLAGDTTDADRRLAAAKNLAAIRGYRYLHATAVAELPIRELVDRIDAVPVHKGEPDRVEAAAILGGTAAPKITVSAALDEYWPLTKDRLISKSDDQVRRWKNPRIKAIKNFLNVVGDKNIADITGDDMLDFRGWWMDRIVEDGLSANAANKDLSHFGTVMKTLNSMKRLGLVLPLSDLSFAAGEAKTRPPFSEKWIRENLLAPGALAGLNAEARAIFLTMINTGARPSEIAGLTAGCIHLAANVPHISIEPIGRELKSANARRKIPLTGVSLEAMRAFPEGFPRYQENSSGLSAALNKYLKSNNLKETPNHTVYSLRHAFEDRLLAAGVDERIRRDLMGHALDRQRYGSGGSLEQTQALVAKVAI
ncbi:tyrosine-type recombinase/integrase [Yoonia sp.]|uniref:tyrosine-type recombinase/integrase n=1 Tax=Yoonia sp. TaxID=2212373 RepID=UPI00391B06F6